MPLTKPATRLQLSHLLDWMAAEGISRDGIAEAVFERRWPSDDEDSEVVLEKNAPSYEVLASRSQPRVNGKICIEVKVKDSETTEKWPLEAFVDEDGCFTDETVCQWVNNWNDKAAKFPDNKRACLMCSRRAKKGFTICGHCSNKGFNDIIYG